MTLALRSPTTAAAVSDVMPWWRRPWTLGVALMALLAYVPALLSSPGRMPADTKLYLYLDPGRLISDSIWSFDARQFGGWVPHQVIAYLWPSGPWYWFADAVGLPDWVAHRLWIGTILFAAGLGVAWAARRLGLGTIAALAAGFLYFLSPYFVPYISRTSSMLLPWAALGWIVGLTIGAATRSKWRDAALCALVIASTGNVNATALAMIAPAPILWLLLAGAERTITWRRAVLSAVKIGVLSILTSLWWIVMLGIQGRRGADLLDFSESLRDVSYTAGAVDVWRSLGYWLMYVRDAYAATTTAGAAYMTSGRVVWCGFAVLLIGLAGLVFARFAARRFALAVVFVGVVLAVGVHPFDDPSPIADLLTGGGQSGLALALRSSTRALPLMTLGLALGAAALVEAVGYQRRWVRAAGGAFVVLLAIGNLPSLTGRTYVDPALERDENVPAAWTDAAAALDELPEGYRVLQLPGAEFGAYRWGYTVDPPLPGLTDRPLVTRDLLPLGSPATMDLLYALDDRFQVGVAEPAALAPIARLLGADTVWLTGDAAYDRFRTPRPELMSEFFEAASDADVGIGDGTAYGEPVVNQPDVATVDEQSVGDAAVGETVAPVELYPIDDPIAVVRAADRVVVLSGSGDGVVDAAAAGLLDGTEAILYSGSLPADELAAAAADAGLVVVTDTNRQRAHHWRSSQDVTGATESRDGSLVIWPVSGDTRLAVFPDAADDAFTWSSTEGPVTAVATSYGEPFSYQPERRPNLAIDGDPNTAWAVVDHRNQFIEVSSDGPIDHVTLLQASGLDATRRLDQVSVSVNGGPPIVVALDQSSQIAGQRVDVAPTDGPTTVRVTLDAVSPSTTGYLDRSPVGFAEIGVGVGNESSSSPEVIVAPTDLTTALRDSGTQVPVTYVLTRERVAPTNRFRSDPEPALVREIDVPFDQDVTVMPTVRLDARASDTVLADVLGIDGPTASRRLLGTPSAAGWAVADGDETTAWITPFVNPLGSALTVDVTDPAEPLTITQPLGDFSPIAVLRLAQGDTSVEVTLPDPATEPTASITLPDGFVAGPVELTVAAITERTTIDRRFGDPVVLPAAIAEVGNVEPTTMATTFRTECRDDLLAIDGQPVPIVVSGLVADAIDGRTLNVEMCGGSDTLSLAAGTHRIEGTPGRSTGLTVDRVVLDAQPTTTAGAPSSQPDSAPTATVVESGRTDRTIEVTDCPDGCWLILGEGFHDAWAAQLDGESLGAPTLVSGGFNGWWLPGSGDVRTVEVHWTAQRPLTIALILSALTVAGAIALAIWDRRGDPHAMVRTAGPSRLVGIGPSDGIVRSAVAAGLLVVGGALFVEPRYALYGLLVGVAIVLTRRIRVAAVVALAAMARIALSVVRFVATESPVADPGFPWNFERFHRLGLFVAVLLAVSMLARPGDGDDTGVEGDDDAGLQRIER